MNRTARRHGVVALALTALVAGVIGLGAQASGATSISTSPARADDPAATSSVEPTTSPTAETTPSASATPIESPSATDTPTAPAGEATITFVLTDPEGGPIGNHSVTLFVLDDTPPPAGPYPTAVEAKPTDVDGRATFTVVADGETGYLLGNYGAGLDPKFRFIPAKRGATTFVPAPDEAYDFLQRTKYAPSRVTFTAVSQKPVITKGDPWKIDIQVQAKRAERGYFGTLLVNAVYPYANRFELPRNKSGRWTVTVPNIPIGDREVKVQYVPHRRSNMKPPPIVYVKVTVKPKPE